MYDLTNMLQVYKNFNRGSSISTKAIRVFFLFKLPNGSYFWTKVNTGSDMSENIAGVAYKRRSVALLYACV